MNWILWSNELSACLQSHFIPQLHFTSTYLPVGVLFVPLVRLCDSSVLIMVSSVVEGRPCVKAFPDYRFSQTAGGSSGSIRLTDTFKCSSTVFTSEAVLCSTSCQMVWLDDLTWELRDSIKFITGVKFGTAERKLHIETCCYIPQRKV